MKSKVFKSLCGVLMALMVAVSLAPTNAYATTVKARTFANWPPTVTTFKKVVKPVKMGTTTVQVAKKDGYLKFTAPRSKDYTFTLSAAKGKESNQLIACFFEKLSGTTLKPYNLRTNEGRRESPFIVDAKTAKTLKGKTVAAKSENNKKYRYLSKRTVTATLKKGQVVYLCTAGTSAGSFVLNIK